MCHKINTLKCCRYRMFSHLFCTQWRLQVTNGIISFPDVFCHELKSAIISWKTSFNIVPCWTVKIDITHENQCDYLKETPTRYGSIIHKKIAESRWNSCLSSKTRYVFSPFVLLFPIKLVLLDYLTLMKYFGLSIVSVFAIWAVCTTVTIYLP